MHMQILPHDPQSIERITASFRHTDRLYTGPYNYWIEFGASVKESVSPSLLFTIDRPESRCAAAQTLLNHFQ